MVEDVRKELQEMKTECENNIKSTKRRIYITGAFIAVLTLCIAANAYLIIAGISKNPLLQVLASSICGIAIVANVIVINSGLKIINDVNGLIVRINAAGEKIDEQESSGKPQ